MAAVNLLLAATSFIKDLIFAGFFGTTVMADSLNTAFLLPDAIGGNLIAYVLGVAAVPYLTRLWSSDRKDEFIGGTKGIAFHSFLAMTVVGAAMMLLKDPILALFGTSAGSLQQVETFYLMLIPCMLLFPLSAVGGAALQSIGSFYIPAAGPVVYNLTILAALLVVWLCQWDLSDGGLVFAGSIILGLVLSMLLTWSFLAAKLPGFLHMQQRSGTKAISFSSWFKQPLIIYKNIFPLFLVVALSQALFAIERMLASHGPMGTLAGLNYAYRIAQFPNWVFITALTSVILPVLSRSNVSSGRADTLYSALRLTFVIMVPAALILCLWREPIIKVLFERGAFDAESVKITSSLLAGYSLSVIGQAISAVCLRFCLASGSMRAPAWIYAITVFVIAVFDMLLLERMGPAALGYGALLGWSVNAVMMIGLVLRDSKYRRG